MSNSKTTTVYFALETFLGLFTEEESYWSYGGAEMQMYYLARAFAKRPHTSVILLTAYTPPKITHPNINAVKIKLPCLGDPSQKYFFTKIPPIKQLLNLYVKFVNRTRRKKLFENHEGHAVFLMSQFENEDLIKTAQKKV